MDLTAAYDTVNHNLLCKKLYEITRGHKSTTIIRAMLNNRMFYIINRGKLNRWKRQVNGIPRGSVFAPLLFNIYTNDQLIGVLSATTPGDMHAEVQGKLKEILDKLETYYLDNALRPNPSKTQVCGSHLKNDKARCTLKLNWGGVQLENCKNPKYLGITLD